MGGSKEVTVGYRYYFGIHMGIGRGPVDELVEIRVGDRRAWSGSVTSNTRININKGYLFGGDEAEGGIVGGLDVLMGEADQSVLARLKNMLGGLVPAFRGMFTLFFDGQIGAMNPYPKPWKIRYRRHTKGWDGACWYPEKVKIELADGEIHAMNPAHMLVACQTDRRWGRGLSDNRIDYQSYTAAADRLYSEGFGLCLLWTRKESVNAFMQTIIDHIGGAQFISRRTGLMTLRLIRDDYVPGDLPLFTYDSGLLSIEEDTLSAGETIPNEVVVNYRDPITNEDRTAREQNLGAIQSAGTVISTSAEYPGLPTHELASRVAQREIRAQRGVRKFKVRLDRRGAALEPGGVFRISAPDDGIDQVVLRVGRIEAGTVNDAAITVTALLDVFGLPSNVYTEQQPSTWQPPNRTAQPALYQRLLEVSYRDLVRQTTQAQRDALEPDSSFLGALGVRPSGLSLNYNLTTRIGAGAFEKQDVGNWVPTAVLEAEIGPEDGVVTLANGVDLELVVPGRSALLGDEIVRVDSLDLETMEAGLSRGCVDTFPARHSAGTRIWFYDAYAAADPTEYIAGDTVDAKLISRTTGDQLDPALAPTMSLQMAQRHARPYPPADVQLNGKYWPDQIIGQVVISWVPRDRILQQDVLVPWFDPGVGPEPGTTYRARIVDSDTDQVLYEVDDLVESPHVAQLPSGTFTLGLELWAQREGLDSWRPYSHIFEFDNSKVPRIVGYSETEFSTTTSQTRTIPPAAAGSDLLLAFVMHRESLSVPDGWQLVAETASFSSRGGDQFLSCLVRVAVPGEGGGTVAFTQSGSARMASQVLVIRSAAPPVIRDSDTLSEADTADSTIPAAPVAATAENQLAITSGSSNLAGEGTSTLSFNDADWSQTTPSVSSDASNGLRMGIAYKGLAFPETVTGAFEANFSDTDNGVGSISVVVGSQPHYDPHFASVASLLHFAGVSGQTTINDEKGLEWSPWSAAAISTEDSAFGGTSLYLDGSADRIATPSAPFDITGDFTCECWAKWEGGGRGTIFSMSDGPSTGFYLAILSNSNPYLVFCGGSYETAEGTVSMPEDQWAHVAVVKSGGSIYVFIDGIQSIELQYSGAAANPSNEMRLGAESLTSGRDFAGYLDEFRFTNGVARYTSDFARPTLPFADSEEPEA